MTIKKLTKPQLRLLKSYIKGIKLPVDKTEENINKLLELGYIEAKERESVADNGVVTHGYDYVSTGIYKEEKKQKRVKRIKAFSTHAIAVVTTIIAELIVLYLSGLLKL